MLEKWNVVNVHMCKRANMFKMTTDKFSIALMQSQVWVFFMRPNNDFVMIFNYFLKPLRLNDFELGMGANAQETMIEEKLPEQFSQVMNSTQTQNVRFGTLSTSCKRIVLRSSKFHVPRQQPYTEITFIQTSNKSNSLCNAQLRKICYTSDY